MIHVRINPADELPIYRQVMRQITDAIAGGRLVAGNRLLSHRELSAKLVIAPLTVKKAYDELEAQGYIESQRGRGTFVSARPPRTAPAVHKAAVRKAARALLATAYLAGLSWTDVMTVLERADDELINGPAQGRRKDRDSA